MRNTVLALALLFLTASVGAAPNRQGKKVLAVQTTAHSVTLSWTQAVVPAGATCPSGSGSIAVTANTIYRGTTSGSETSYATLSTPATTYTDTGVTAGASYVYEVTATNCASESAKSNEVSATIPNPLPPGAPTGLTVTGSQ